MLQTTLNSFMAAGKGTWDAVRARLTTLLSANEPTLRDNAELRSSAFIAQADVQMQMPATIGDYTDCYASKEHATNIGTHQLEYRNFSNIRCVSV